MVGLALRRRAMDRGIAGARGQFALEGLAVDSDTQFRGLFALGIEEVELQLASAGLGHRADTKNDRKRVRAAVGPGVGGAGLDVRPVALWVGLADDEKGVIRELGVTGGGEGELGV